MFYAPLIIIETAAVAFHDQLILFICGMSLCSHSKEDVWDNLMRIKSSQIAAELLEIAMDNKLKGEEG